MKVFDLNGSQSITVIPRSEFTGATLEVLDEFTKEVNTFNSNGTYDNGFFTLNFTFMPKKQRTYKLTLTSNNTTQWKGKAIAQE